MPQEAGASVRSKGHKPLPRLAQVKGPPSTLCRRGFRRSSLCGGSGERVSLLKSRLVFLARDLDRSHLDGVQEELHELLLVELVSRLAPAED